MFIIVCFHVFTVAIGSSLRSQSCARKMSILQITTESIEVTNPTPWNGNLFFNSPTVCAVSALTEAWLSQIFQNYQDSDLGSRKYQFHPSKIDADLNRHL